MWMMAGMLALTAASTAMSAASAQKEGAARQGAFNAQATAATRAAFEAEQQASEVDLQVQQEEAIRMAQLESMIGSNATRAVAAGITTDSASLQAIEERSKLMVGRDIANVKYMGSAKAAALRRQAGYGRDAGETYVEAGREARSAANLAMWGSIAKGASTAAMYGAFGGLGGKGGGGDPSSGGLGKTASGNVFG